MLCGLRVFLFFFFFFSSRRRHTRLQGDWSSDVCSSDLSTQLESTVVRYPSSVIATVVRHSLGLIDRVVWEQQSILMKQVGPDPSPMLQPLGSDICRTRFFLREKHITRYRLLRSRTQNV